MEIHNSHGAASSGQLRDRQDQRTCVDAAIKDSALLAAPVNSQCVIGRSGAEKSILCAVNYRFYRYR